MPAPTLFPMVAAKSLGAKCQTSSRNSHAQLIQRLEGLEARIDKLYKEVSGQISKLHADMVTINGHSKTEGEILKRLLAETFTEVMLISSHLRPGTPQSGRARGGTVTER